MATDGYPRGDSWQRLANVNSSATLFVALDPTVAGSIPALGADVQCQGSSYMPERNGTAVPLALLGAELAYCHCVAVPDF